MQITIEDIVLDHDRRGISALRPYLATDFCGEAATLVLEHPGTVMIVTGFYILSAGAIETDGPPGAIVIGDALQSIGYDVVYVTDNYSGPIMKEVIGSKAKLVEFPIMEKESSEKFSRELLLEFAPSVLISIERCGLDNEGFHRNMHGQDISNYTASIDYLFSDHPTTIGIGDGGNEIGMGNLVSVIPTVSSLVNSPCVIPTNKLVISSVSNWGGYGLVAALSLQKKQNLLPVKEVEQKLLKRIVDLGAVDGMSGRCEYKVDGFSLDENSQTVERLHRFLADHGVLR